MTKKLNKSITPTWVEGELRLVGALNSRMIGLLRAIDQSGSINQAAKQTGLSYKGAWQMIERANNLAPKVLITTATGGSKGGGTCLTAAGQSLLQAVYPAGATAPAVFAATQSEFGGRSRYADAA